MNADHGTYELMIPGPVKVDDEVLVEMASPIVAHYGRDWACYYNGTVAMLKQIMQTSSDLFILVGSGHVSVEAAVCSLVEAGKEAIVVDTGFFGHRINEIAAAHGALVRPINAEYGTTVTPEQVNAALEAYPSARVVCMVHHETSTGLVNPVKEVAEVCRKNDAILMVDAVSSIGGIDVPVDEWGIDVCATASQKCLEAPPGLAIISVSERAWNHMKARNKPIQGWYLNLLNWKSAADSGQHSQPYPITMAVNNVRALRRAAERILEEGLAERFNRHRLAGEMLRMGLSALGLELIGSAEEASGIVSVFSVPDGHVDTEIVDFLRRHCGIQVAGGLGDLSGKAIRIGHMGPTATTSNVNAVLDGIAQWLKAVNLYTQ